MYSMNLLDITIRYFNLIIFLLCVFFGLVSFFASWIAWREIHRKKNIIRSVIAAYNIAEDALEKGKTPSGDLRLDPAIVETVFNSLLEVLNAIYGEMTGKLVPARDERLHGKRRLLHSMGFRRAQKEQKNSQSNLNTQTSVLLPEDEEHHQIIHP